MTADQSCSFHWQGPLASNSAARQSLKDSSPLISAKGSVHWAISEIRAAVAGHSLCGSEIHSWGGRLHTMSRLSPDHRCWGLTMNSDAGTAPLCESGDARFLSCSTDHLSCLFLLLQWLSAAMSVFFGTPGPLQFWCRRTSLLFSTANADSERSGHSTASWVSSRTSCRRFRWVV